MNAAACITVTAKDNRRLCDLVAVYSEQDSYAAAALQCALDRAVVVAPSSVSPFVVTMNSRVTCRDEGGLVQELMLVYPWNADAHAGKVSVLAPIGRALLGTKVGDTFTVGGTRWTVEAILYQPEAAGDFDR